MLRPEPSHYSRRQSEILDIVEAVYLREGLRLVRISELTDEAHCSRSTLYELAPSKEELFLLVVDRLIRRVRVASHDALERETDPVARLKAALSASALGFAQISPPFMESVREYQPSRMLLEQHLAQAQANLARLVDDAVAVGAFRSVDTTVVAEVLQAVIDRFTDPAFTSNTGLDLAIALGTFFDILVDGLHAPSRG